MDKEKYKDKRILLIRSWPSFFIEETSHLGRTPQASHHPPVAAPFPLLLQASLPVNTPHSHLKPAPPLCPGSCQLQKFKSVPSNASRSSHQGITSCPIIPSSKQPFAMSPTLKACSLDFTFPSNCCFIAHHCSKISPKRFHSHHSAESPPRCKNQCQVTNT